MGSIPVGSTKKQTLLCLLLLSRLGIERLLTQPDSRTLGVLAAIREYQNDCEDSRFFNPDSESKDGVPSSRFPYARQARCYTGVPKRL